MHNRTEKETRSGSPSVRSDPYHLPAHSVPYNNLPPRGEFIGRETEKRILLEAIASRSPLISIEGIGGIGKTVLALEVAHELAEVTRRGLTDLEMARDVKLPIFEAFVWVTAKDRELNLDQVLDAIALTLDCRRVIQLPLDEKAREITKILQVNSTLIILDNFEVVKDDAIRSFILDLPEPSKALLTSRYREMPQAWSISLKGLSKEETLSLIRNERRRLGLPAVSQADEKVLMRIYETTGGVPLAIKWALGQVQRGRPLDHVLGTLYSAKADLFEILFRRAWEMLSVSAKRILTAMTLFESSAAKDAIAAVSDIHGVELDEGLAQLAEMHLLDIGTGLNDDTGRYGVHPLTRAFVESLLVEQWPTDYRDVRMDLPKARAFYSQLATAISTIGERGQPQHSRLATLTEHFCSLLDLPSPAVDVSSVYKDLYAFPLETGPAFANISLPTTMPFVYHQRRDFTESDLDDLRFLITERLGLPTRIAFLVLLGGDELLAHVRKLVDARMREIYAYDVILLGRGELQRLVVAKDPWRALRQLVLPQVNLVTISPFVTTGPTPDNMFFGRERELREIVEHAATVSYAVIAGRRFGKTSILKRLERVRLPAVGFRALYHDCSYTPTQIEMVQAVLADRTWFPDPPAIPLTSFAAIIQALPDDKPLIILLDEADKLILPDQVAGYLLLNTLRAMANAGRCRFVLSGERALRTELMNPNSPLYNFADEMLIGRLDFRAVEELVTRPMKQLEIELDDETEIVQRIWDFTSGHPNVVQRLCQRLIVLLNERQGRHLTLDDVETVVADPDFLRKDLLSVYWERATTLERLCSLVMAADDRVCTLTTAHKALVGRGVQVTLNQVDDALERLVDLRNILQRTVEGYDFAVTAFPEVIAKTARLDDLITLNCEIYQCHSDVEPRSKRGVS